VTAVLFRPMDVAAKIMPGRALGLTWAAVDPAERRLGLRLTAAPKILPRSTLNIGLDPGDLAAAQDA
jgi:uncharacterized protein YfaS (alpha-2-macroglobulin family)